MARIVLGSYVIRYPLGGYLSWVLQWMVGLDRLGHEVWFVEKAGGPDACYDPTRQASGDDCAYGARTWQELLARHGLGGRWCFVDHAGRYHGTSRRRIEEVLATADVFLDMGTHGAWMDEARRAGLRVLIDGEPGATQMKMCAAREAGEALAEYDHYYTVGRNVGTPASTAPDAGVRWRPLFYPVETSLFRAEPIPAGAPFTTVMSWSAHRPVTHAGRTYGAKDAEFARFLDLPGRAAAPLELAVAGRTVPRADLEAHGWRLRDAQATTISYDALHAYLRGSHGEFSVAKEVFVATRSGWFGDRAGAYLASGRPVVLQDTGFGDHLPTGRGLFAVRGAEEAAEAIARIVADPTAHARAARDIAREHLEARTVLGGMLDDLGVAPAPARRRAPSTTSRRPVAVAVGFIGKLPLAGMSLYNMHYLAGLQELGYDVHYVEHWNKPGDYYNPSTGALADDVEPALPYVAARLGELGIGTDRMSLIDADGRCHGAGWPALRAALDTADFALTLADPAWFDELERCPRRGFVDGDPMFTQVAMLDPDGDATWADALRHYPVLFSYGRRMGRPDCAVPGAGRDWIPTVPVVATRLWDATPPADAAPVVSLVQWSKHKVVVHDGVAYGPKNSELERLMELPRRSQRPLVLALAGGRAPRDALSAHGWRLADALETTQTMGAYRRFIAGARADLGIAKHAYVASRSGWFSDRSTCFLAAGRPVLHQDTGFGDWLAPGEGVLAFSTIDEAADGLAQLESDYDRHALAARAIAREHFEAADVVGRMLDTAGFR